MSNQPKLVLKVEGEIERGKYAGTQLRFYLERCACETGDVFNTKYYFQRTPQGRVGDLIHDVTVSGVDQCNPEKASLFAQKFIGTNDVPKYWEMIVQKDPKILMVIHAMHKMIDLAPDAVKGSLEDAFYERFDQERIKRLVDAAVQLTGAEIGSQISQEYGIYLAYQGKERKVILCEDEIKTDKFVPDPADFLYSRAGLVIFPSEVVEVVQELSGEGTLEERTSRASVLAANNKANTEKIRSMIPGILADVHRIKDHLEPIN